MRKVVDSNFLQSEGLRAYFSKSSQNFAVLTDYASMEAYKGDTLRSIYRSMEVAAQFPKQIIVLKGTQIVRQLKGRDAGLQRRLIDEKQTRGFTKYCQLLLAAKHGDIALQNQLLHRGRVASTQMDRVLSYAEGLPAVLNDIAKTYTETELRLFRSGSEWTTQMLDKMILHIQIMTAKSLESCHQPTQVPEVLNKFVFRQVLCAYLIGIDWISVGGAMSAKATTMRNDLIDANFAAYATYFDGLLTEDKKLKKIYADAVSILSTIKSVRFTSSPSAAC